MDDIGPTAPVAREELAPATMMVARFPRRPSGASGEAVWRQAQRCRPGGSEFGRQSQLFIGEKGMLLGNEAASRGEGRGLPEGRPERCRLAPPLGESVEPHQGNSQYRLELPVSGGQPGGSPRQHGLPTGRAQWDDETLPAKNTPEAARSSRTWYRKGWQDILKMTRSGSRVRDGFTRPLDGVGLVDGST